MLDLGPVHMILGQLIAPGQLTDPGVNFASVHGLMPVTVHMSFSWLFSMWTERKSCPVARDVLHMLIIVRINFSTKKFQNAPEIGKHV